MAQNISKYVAINDFILLEYVFNKGADPVQNINNFNSFVGTNLHGEKFYFENKVNPFTNNSLQYNSVPESAKSSTWFFPGSLYDSSVWGDKISFDEKEVISGSYYFDTVRLHIVSGYDFQGLFGILLKIYALTNNTNEKIVLTNFTWNRYNVGVNPSIYKFSSNALFLGNKFYDKYIEIKIPSITQLSNDNVSQLGKALNIKKLSDVYIELSEIGEYDIPTQTYILNSVNKTQFPLISNADYFNAFLAESENGDFIEFYATWRDQIIGNNMNEIEMGRIPLYSSNNDFENFSDTYGVDARKWVLIHEINVYEVIGSNITLSQKYSFTQDSDFEEPNFFRPILKNADIDSYFYIDYFCRLMNRMDGTQIIRKCSFASDQPKKYGRYLTKINVDNIVNYTVFNKIQENVINNVSSNNNGTKYVKVYYDTSNISLNNSDDVVDNILLIKSNNHNYKFIINDIKNGELIRHNLSTHNYVFCVKLDDGSEIRLSPVDKKNSNYVRGEIMFYLTGDNAEKMLKNKTKIYSIQMVENGISSTLFEGKYQAYLK